MPTRPHKNAIWIGDDRWIEFIDLDGRYDQAVHVDAPLSSLEAFWSALETMCVAGCCGFDAFDFSPEGIAEAARGLPHARLHDQLEEAIRVVEKLDTTVVVSRRLNNLADKRTFLALLSHVKACLPATWHGTAQAGRAAGAWARGTGLRNTSTLPTITSASPASAGGVQR
jgi:hypothetical protein